MWKKKKFVLSITCSLVFSAAFAAPITGSIDSDPGDGLTANSQWNRGDAEIDWKVTLLPNNAWKYEWDIEVEDRDIAYSIFEVGIGFTAAHVLPGTTSGWSLGTFGTASNAGLPSPLTGIRFPGSGEEDHLVLITNYAPGWGDAYVRGETNRGNSTYAFNTTFGGTSSTAPTGHAPDGLVLAPIGAPTQVSEPAELALFGVGVLMLSSTARMRKKRTSKS